MVTLSTTEVEYISATEAIKEGVWVQGLLHELNVYKGVATIYSDSQRAIHLCRNPVFHDRTKHVEVKYHFIKEKVDEGTLNIQYIHTAEQTADILTKPLFRPVFEKLVHKLGMYNLYSPA